MVLQARRGLTVHLELRRLRELQRVEEGQKQQAGHHASTGAR